MKKIAVMVIGLAVFLFSLSFADEDKKMPKKELKTYSEKLSYSLGMEIGGSLKALQKDIDITIFIQGLEDNLRERKALLTQQEAAEVKKEYLKKIQETKAQKMKDTSEKNQKEADAFLAANKAKKGVITTKSGLQYMVVNDGNGPVPLAEDTVKVHYKGTTIDGTEFDSSHKRGEPAVFKVKGVIPGWVEALQLMKVGSKYRLFIPPELAYGQRGAGPQIGPNSALIFDVELLGIEK
ncbi:Outer membrane protein MIP [Candidatus Magnetomoraceae bacterium gMMP-1]